MNNKTLYSISGIGLLIVWLSLVSAVTLTVYRTVYADPGVLYAAPSARGSGDCSTWANAGTLQTALTSAISDDEIWVQSGVYYPGSNRTDTFALQRGVSLYGGFAGDETSREQRDWATNVTVLSGDIDGNDLTDPTGVVTNTDNITGTNSYHVVTCNGVTETAVLDGFFITAGLANDPYDEECNGLNCGGGMFNEFSSPTLTNITFSGNSAEHLGGGMYNDNSSPTLNTVTFISNTTVAGDGGGMFNNRESSPALTNVAFFDNWAKFNGGGMGNATNSHSTLTNVTFHGNEATYGGGMSNWIFSNPTLINVTFNGNLGYDQGGGMYNFNQCSPTLTDVVFIGNQSPTGGGMNNYADCSPSLANVTFIDNQANSGGGMYNNSSMVVMTQVLFSGNQGVNGGAIHNYQSSVTMTNTTIADNTAVGEGGGIYNDGGGAFIHDSIMVLTQVLFSGNQGVNGGAMHNIQSNVTMTNISMAGNLATEQGGGIYNDGSDSYIQNALIWGNQSDSGGDNLFNNEFGSTTIRFSLVGGCNPGGVWNSACGVDGGGNIESNPLFVDASNGNLRLQLTSPAIDAGINVALPSNILTDLDGNLRFVDIPTISDSGSGSAPIVDMGAYEAQFVDVALSKAVLPSIAAPGEAITFILTLSNTGSLLATDIEVTDTMPAWLTGVSFTSSLTVTDTGSIPAYVWSVQDLARGQGGTITVSGVLPVPLSSGTYTNTAFISATDDLLAANNSAFLTYTVPNVAPVFTSLPVSTTTAASPYTYTISTQDNNGDALTITASTLPDWLTLTDHQNGTATLTGTPVNAEVGNHSVVLHATDSGGLATTQSFFITVWGRVYLPLLLRNAP